MYDIRNSHLEALLVELYEVGRQPFPRTASHAVGKLLEEFTPAEILGAYKEFVVGRTAYQMRTAVETFCDTARQILLARRKRPKQTAA